MELYFNRQRISVKCKKLYSLNLFCLALVSLSLCQNPFSITTYSNGTYSLYVNGKEWLKSAPTFFRDSGKLFTAEDGSLKLFYTVHEVGVDKLGNFTTSDYLYWAGKKEMFVSIRQYDHAPNLVVFIQVYIETF